MKKLLFLVAILCTSVTNAQLKGDIDEELLSEMVLAKQEEVKKRFLTNFIRKNIKMTNHVTYNTMYDIMDVLLNEKNKTTMTNALVQKVANYSVSYAAVWYFIKSDCDSCLEGIYEGFSPDEMNKDPRKRKPSKYTTGFKGKDDPFKELTQAYRRERKDTTENKKRRHDKDSTGTQRSDHIHIDQNADFLVGLHNWLIDEMYKRLSRDTVFRSMGLFKPDEERSWQWSGLTEYDAFWVRYGEVRRDAISTELDTFITKVARGGGELIAMANAIGLDNAEDLKGFDIRHLGDWKNTALSVLGKSNGAANAVGPVANSADSLDSATLNRAMTMLGEVLGTVRAQQENGVDRNKVVGAVFGLFMKTVELFRLEVGENSIIARIADIITKYVILDPEIEDPLARYGFTIDVEAIILGLEDRLIEKGSSPTKHALFNIRPFMTIGLNYGYFGGPSEEFEASDTYGLQQIAWAGEKIGLKWRVADWKYTRGQPKDEWYKYHNKYYRRWVRPRQPDISNLYFSLYASGILYNIADLRTDETFRRPIVGLGSGIAFFNGLELNLSYAVPIVEGFDLTGAERRGFANIGFDIPLFDYIRAAREKRAK